jgi:hypothetical protein
MSYDDLLDVFQGTEETIMHSFNQNVIKEDIHEQYE